MTSYPYMNLARRLGLDYGQVLRTAECFESENVLAVCDPPLSPPLVAAVQKTWEREQARRKAVCEERA